MPWPWKRREPDRTGIAIAEAAVRKASEELACMEERTRGIDLVAARARLQAGVRPDALDDKIRDSLAGGHPT